MEIGTILLSKNITYNYLYEIVNIEGLTAYIREFNTNIYRFITFCEMYKKYHKIIKIKSRW